MSKYKGYVLLLGSLLFGGFVFAAMSIWFWSYFPAQGETQEQTLRDLSVPNRPTGTVISVVNYDTGYYENFLWNGQAFQPTGESGYRDSQGGPLDGGSGGSGGASGGGGTGGHFPGGGSGGGGGGWQSCMLINGQQHGDCAPV